MRIAVSGTHCNGKSTLIDEFLSVHTNFAHEPEPYTVLVEDFGEEFSEEPCVEDFYRQLEFNADRLRQYPPGKNVIYERCPIDFLAYIDALDSNSVKRALGLVSEAIEHLELIAYVPIGEDIDAEFPKLRKAVDRRLSGVYSEDDFGIISSSNVAVVQVRGSTAQRLSQLEEAIRYRTHSPVTPRKV